MANSNAFLAALGVTAGSVNYDLSPRFSPISLSYRTIVPSGTASVTIKPFASDAGATITVNGVAVVSGAASGAITVQTGPNPIEVRVTASDTTSYLNYVVTVFVQLANPVTDNFWIVKKDTSIQKVSESMPPRLVDEVILDQEYRDQSSIAPSSVGAAILARLTPGITNDQAPSSNVSASITAQSGPDDYYHIPPRQMVFQYSYWEFTDTAGNLLAFVPWDVVSDVVNIDPNA